MHGRGYFAGARCYVIPLHYLSSHEAHHFETLPEMNTEQFAALTQRLARIESILDNDTGTGRLGLYQEQQQMKAEMHEIKKRVQKVEEAQRFDKWRYSAIAGAVGAGLATGSKWLLAALAKMMY